MPGRRNQPERDEQQALVQWMRLQHPKELLVHVPNELVRGCAQARASWLSGLCPGMPDLILFCPRGQWHALIIEMKRKCKKGEHKGKISLRQVQIMEHLQSKGYKCIVAFGFEAGKKAIEEYLKL